MDLSSLTLPEWLPWWAPVVALAPLALYLALFLLMPFHTFGLRGRLAAIEAQLEDIQSEIRALTLRLPEPTAPGEAPARPPIPPAPEAPARGAGFGDPVADKMLAYMRDRAQADLRRGPAPPRPRAEPRLNPALRPAPKPEDEVPPPPALDAPTGTPAADAPPRPPRVPLRFGRRHPPPGGDDEPPAAPPPGGAR